MCFEVFSLIICSDKQEKNIIFLKEISFKKSKNDILLQYHSTYEMIN